MKLSKDSDGLLIAISNLENNKRKELNTCLEELKEHVEPTKKKSKTTKLFSL